MKIKMILRKENYVEQTLLERGTFLKFDCLNIVSFGQAMYDGYLNTVDYEGESLEDSIHFIEQIKSKTYGEMMNEFSGIIEENGIYISGIIITLFDTSPFIVTIFTKHAYKNRGYGEYILRLIIHGVFSKTNYSKIILYVTDNNSAISLYKKIGFVETSF